MVCSKRTSFIDLKMLSVCTDIVYSSSRLARITKRACQKTAKRLPSDGSGPDRQWKMNADLASNHLCALYRTVQAVVELHHLDMRDRPDWLKVLRRLSSQGAVLFQPLAEQLAIGVAMLRVVSKHVK